ncbi:PQQ-dependent sugar dehydrogenase [Rhodoplanes sp. Z2-YC6860]|uniref:PQQ-dependent sugar dehydrogenase n=1 Tax=Rhodoplanes sp. Z2-YC6860 TaxID=674703 RepID=UPI00082FF928|nr:PQQ-dependent sugar dehydrogenase [Rhodoplanes sp. Z2-YC6860]
MALGIAALSIPLASTARAQSAPAASPKPQAAPDSPAALPDQEIGRRITIKADDLPPPKTGPIAASRSMTVPFTGQAPNVPEGFTATPFVTGLEHPRRLLVLPNGDVLVAEQKVGYVTLLRDDDGDGKADWIDRHIEGLNGPYGLAWRDGKILVADQDGIWEVPHRLGALRPGAGGGDTKAADVPLDQRKPTPALVGEKMLTKKGVFGIVMGHANRHLAIDPKTGGLFVGVGSSGNIGVEPAVKASIQRFDADGGNQTTYASGTRNPTALAFQPDTGELYAVVQERDGLGDNLAPDYMIHVKQGAFYGWPYSYIGHHPQPGFAQLRPDKVKAAVTPDVLFQAHSSALDIVFYTGSQFPSEYKGDAFVALKGSWNRSEPTGYKVVRVPFKDGKPQGFYQNFMTGFWVSGLHRAEVWGRPAALAVAKDGALLVADDTGGTIWRVAYTGAKPGNATPASPPPTTGSRQ